MLSYEDYAAEQDKWESKRPKCANCNEPIQDGYGYEVEPGTIWCWDCAEGWLRDQRQDIDEMMEEGW